MPRFQGTEASCAHGRIAAIPGDGIGKEVVAAGLEVLLACAERRGINTRYYAFRLGFRALQKNGRNDAGRRRRNVEEIRCHSFRSSGYIGCAQSCHALGPETSDMSTARPIRQCSSGACSEGIQSPLRAARPKDIDWVIIRENSEGEYSGQGDGRIADLRRKSRQRLRFSRVRACEGLCVLRLTWRVATA